jgi:plasmid stabilization system protein ParE
MADVVWSDAALHELVAIRAYIAIFDPAAASRIVTKLRQAGDSLADFPRRGRPSVDGLREMVTVAPYVLCYDVVGESVTILRIRHGRRYPGAR